MNNSVYYFRIPSLVPETFKFLMSQKLEIPVINDKIENISVNIGQMLFKLGSSDLHQVQAQNDTLLILGLITVICNVCDVISLLKKTLISLERRKVFQNRKDHFSFFNTYSHALATPIGCNCACCLLVMKSWKLQKRERCCPS